MMLCRLNFSEASDYETILTVAALRAKELSFKTASKTLSSGLSRQHARTGYSQLVTAGL